MPSKLCRWKMPVPPSSIQSSRHFHSTFKQSTAMRVPTIIVLSTMCLFGWSSAAGLRGIPTDADSAAHRRLQNDRAFIHKGCSTKKGLRPEWTDGVFGLAWYCSDGEPCGPAPFDTCDRAQIHRGCAHSKGLKPKYDHSTHAWFCSDHHHHHHPHHHGFVEIDTSAEQCVREHHPLWHKHEHKHGHGHGHTVGAAMATASAGGGGRRYVCYQSCCVEHSSVIAFDSGFIESESDVSCESEWSTCGGPSPAPHPGYDSNCYIHSGCLTGKAGYSTDPNDSMGEGWYCTDGQYVDMNTKFDACEIHSGCDSGAAYWDSNQSVWKCAE